MNKDSEIQRYPEIGKIYKHYKGGKYKVWSLAKHSETGETMVVYKSIHYGSVHVRPLKMWFDKIKLEKGETERFTLVKRGWFCEFFWSI